MVLAIVMHPSSADMSAVENQSMVKIPPFLSGQYLHQVSFDFHWIFEARKIELSSKPRDMRIDCYPFDNTVCIPQNNIGSFASHARKCKQFFHSFRNFAAVDFFYSLHSS